MDTRSVCHCDDCSVCSDHLNRSSSPYHAGELLYSNCLLSYKVDLVIASVEI